MKKCICADCGQERDDMNFCEKCGSCRAVLISFCETMFGPKWRNAFLPPDHPNQLKQSDIPKDSPIVLTTPRSKLPHEKE